MQLERGSYSFTYISSENDCNSSTTIIIDKPCEVLPCSIEEDGLYISKAVTPNGDTYNDYFEVGGELQEGCGFEYEVKIFELKG